MVINKSKSELIDTGKTKRYTKRNQDGWFKKSVDSGASDQSEFILYHEAFLVTSHKGESL